MGTIHLTGHPQGTKCIANKNRPKELFVAFLVLFLIGIVKVTDLILFSHRKDEMTNRCNQPIDCQCNDDDHVLHVVCRRILEIFSHRWFKADVANPND